VLLFDADGDGDNDLFVGNSPVRVDGMPSPNRLYLNDGMGGFTRVAASGLERSIGAGCVQAADIDSDSRPDLLVCGSSADPGTRAGPRLFRNRGGARFADATVSLGVEGIGDLDAELADVNGDGCLDLVQVSRDRLRVSLHEGGRFRVAAEYAISAGMSVATGDVNGDGRLDIYVQRGEPARNVPDLLLVNDGTGRSFTSAIIPQVETGTAEGVVALDHDGNGLTDFLVLNGLTSAGPVQLIAFAPAQDP
jgi:hypothetical protein